ncbi:hypothetical protein EI94DRAFT_1615368, partial [Lactarius quietus]
NAVCALARYHECLPTLYRGLNVLGRGSGADLPGLVAAARGPLQVVLTDCPDQALVNNMAHNVAQDGVDVDVVVLGYVWGHPVEPLLAPLSSSTSVKLDPIRLSDLVFNLSQLHRALLWTCEHALAPRGCMLMFFTHHIPHLPERDLGFLDIACDKVLTERFAPIFPEDMGEEDVWSTAHRWKLTRPGGDWPVVLCRSLVVVAETEELVMALVDKVETSSA